MHFLVIVKMDCITKPLSHNKSPPKFSGLKQQPSRWKGFPIKYPNLLSLIQRHILPLKLGCEGLTIYDIV